MNENKENNTPVTINLETHQRVKLVFKNQILIRFWLMIKL